jgi:hypothetical protein
VHQLHNIATPVNIPLLHNIAIPVNIPLHNIAIPVNIPLHNIATPVNIPLQSYHKSGATWLYKILILLLLLLLPIQWVLTLSNPIFLPTTYSPALICFGR